MLWLHIIVFIISCSILVLVAKKIIDSLDRIAKFLGWKEFVVAFFTVSFGAVAPEFFIGISSAFHKIPELSFGNILGQNILLFSFTVALCAIILKNGIEVESRTVRGGCTFAVIAAILPLLLIWDGVLSRTDGLILLSFFVFFMFWLFSRKERFTKVYDGIEQAGKKNSFFRFLKDVGIICIGFLFVILSAQGIIWSAQGFENVLALSLPLVGLLIVAFGVGLPETYFALMLAKKGQSWMILGGIMGAVTISSTLVLGTVALISPINIEIEKSPTLILARAFLVLSALLFLFFARTRNRISTKEGILLLLLYFSFLAIFFVIEFLMK